MAAQQYVAAVDRPSSADLVIEFEGQRTLELITDTSGIQPWNLVAPGLHLVACCGGGGADFGAARRQSGRERSISRVPIAYVWGFGM